MKKNERRMVELAAPAVLSRVLSRRDLLPGERAHIEGAFRRYRPAVATLDPAELERDVRRFVAGALEEAREIARLLGVTAPAVQAAG